MTTSASLNNASDSGSSPITPRFAWYVLCRWGRLAVPLGLLTMLLASGLVLYLFEPQYRAEALLQIKKQRPIVAMQIDGGVSNEFVETQKQLMRSSPVLSKVLAKPEVARLAELRREEDPKKWIQQRLEVKPVGGSELLTVAYQGPSAESAKLIVDAVVSAYFTLQANQNDEQITKLLNALESVKQNQISNVARLEKLVLETAKKSAGDTALVVNPKGQGLLELNPAVLTLQQDLSKVEFERQMTATEIEAFQQQGASAEPAIGEAELEKLVAESEEVLELKERIRSEQRDLGALQPGTVHYERKEKSLQDFQRQLDDARMRVRERLVEEGKTLVAAADRDRLAKMKSLLAEYDRRDTLLRARLEEERSRMESQTGNKYELEFLMNDLARAKQVADKIEDRISGLRIEYLSPQRPEQVFVVQPAEIPAGPMEAYPFKSLALAGLAGFLIPFATFGAFEMLSRRLYQSDQLADRSQLALLGEVAALPSRPVLSYGGAVRRYLRDRAIFEESVESLRSVLSVSPEWSDAQVLAITSAVSGEGKTSLASQLATGWARHSEARTLIIDGDVRDPDISAIFGIANSPGLAEVIRGDCEQDAAIVHWEGRLDILPAGMLISNPHRLFATHEFAALIDRLRDRYDRIIVDMAPLLSASEVLPMLKSVDGVLLCARKDHSRAPQVKLARDRLERAGIQRIGGVFGGLASHSYAYQYGEYGDVGENRE